jgi:hypothetical protein
MLVYVQSTGRYCASLVASYVEEANVASYVEEANDGSQAPCPPLLSPLLELTALVLDSKGL